LHAPVNQFVNSRSNFGGKTRVGFPVTLPQNTVEWYYTFAATRNEKDIQATKSTMRLFGELSSFLDRTGILSIAFNALSKPPGANYCHVYLLRQDQHESFLAKDDMNFKALPEGTRENLMSGVIKVKNCCNTGSYYIGFRNNDFDDGVHVMIEVVAIVEKEIFETVQVRKPLQVETKTVPVIGG
jgi:hypothetical protein